MKKRVLITTVLIGTLATAGIGLAFNGSDRMMGYGRNGNCTATGAEQNARLEHRLGMMTEILGLNDQQQEQIKQLLATHFAQNRGLREQLQQSRDALREQQRSSSFDEQAFRTLAEKQANLKIELMVARGKLKQQIYALLTPEQQDKAERLQQLRGGRHHGRHGMEI